MSKNPTNITENKSNGHLVRLLFFEEKNSFYRTIPLLEQLYMTDFLPLLKDPLDVHEGHMYTHLLACKTACV